MLEEAARTGDARSPRRLVGLARGFQALLALTFGLIVLGALVRAHEAGLACPDWPFCFGELVPRMNLEVAFEWSHRLIAGTVGVAFLALALATLRQPRARRAAGPLLAVAAALLATQVLLGALTVWLRLAPWTVTAHLVIGNGFALTLLLTACALREAARPPRERGAVPTAARLGVGLAALLLGAQIVLGGLVSSRYAGLACPDWPACTAGSWFPTWQGAVGLHLLHRTNGYALLAVLAAAAWASRGVPGLRGATALAAALGLCQVGVGVANVLLRLPVEVTGLHSALAAALVLAVAFAARETWLRPTGRDPRAAPVAVQAS